MPYSMYSSLDDLSVASNDLSGVSGPTVCLIVKNEMYFLPEFLEHYRKLGARRFVVLDDRSTDGSREYLAAESDVMLVKSASSYGDRIFPNNTMPPFNNIRMVHVWKTLLLRKFCLDEWSLSLDADEFVSLPDGMSLTELISLAESSVSRGITGVMIDIYPRDLQQLTEKRAFKPRGDWYFDGERHLELRPSERPLMLHPGARARLYSTYAINETPLRRIIRKLRTGSLYEGQNWTFKVLLMKWREDDLFANSHWPGLAVDPTLLIPIKHFKFTYDLYRRMEFAITSRSYSNGSIEYQQLARTLERMRYSNASFLYRRSLMADDFTAIKRSGNAVLSFAQTRSLISSD